MRTILTILSYIGASILGVFIAVLVKELADKKIPEFSATVLSTGTAEEIETCVGYNFTVTDTSMPNKEALRKLFIGGCGEAKHIYAICFEFPDKKYCKTFDELYDWMTKEKE